MKVGIGYSQKSSAEEAAIESIRGALKTSGEPVITLLFTTEGYDQKRILSVILKEIGNSKLVGACGGGVITPGGVLQKGIGVCTISGKGIHTITAIQKNIDINSYNKAMETGISLLKGKARKGNVFLFPDGFTPNISEMIRGLYNVMGPEFQYFGGGTGDNLRFIKTYQFTEKGIASNSLSAALTWGRIFIQAGIGHGWQPEGYPMLITKAEGKRVYELDGKPAFDAYSKRLGGIDVKKFPEYGMRNPIGIPDIAGNFLIRDPIKVNQDRSIDFITEVPKNAMVYIMKGDNETLIQKAKSIACTVKKKVKTPHFCLIFDCVSRYLLMGDDFDKELNGIRKCIGEDIPTLGFLTFGEIGAFKDVPLFHNKTTSIVMG